MKKLILAAVLLSGCLSIQAYAAHCDDDCKGKPQCWDQCTKNDDCGAGFNCTASKCGNRCTEEVKN